MFFKKSKAVISISQNRLTGVKVYFKKNAAVIEKKFEKDFLPDDLAKVLKQAKKELDIRSARILLSEERTYLKLLDFPRDTRLTRESILEKIQEVIPEKLEEGCFDWKIVGSDKDQLKIQVLAVSQDYLNSLQDAALQAQLSLEAFEPPSFALARLTKNEKEPHLIIYQNMETIISAVYRGRILGVVIVDDQSQTEAKARELTEFVREKWGVKVKKTIQKKLDPFIGLALKKDIHGGDENVLNLVPQKASTFEIETIQKGNEIPIEDLETGNQFLKLSPKNKRFIFLSTILALLILAIPFTLSFIRHRQETKSKVELTPSFTPTPEPTQQPPFTPTPELKKSDLKIQVLNGRGEAGTAAVAAQFLKDRGYGPEIATGNADSYDYKQTTVKIKEEKIGYLELLLNDLESEYTVSRESSFLEKEETFDAIIIVGKI